jgi:hypothetical protein
MAAPASADGRVAPKLT